MKRVIKLIYMFLFHPVLFFRFSIKNNLIVMKRAEVKGMDQVKIGENVRIGNDLRISVFNIGEKKSIKLIVGDGCYFCNRNSFLVGGNIEIGKNVLVASDVCFISENHSIDPVSEIEYKDQEILYDDVKIGDGCWIGEKVIILPGVSIGTKTIIGAGSVVTHSIPAYSIAVGNPARIIKKFDMNENRWLNIEAGKAASKR